MTSNDPINPMFNGILADVQSHRISKHRITKIFIPKGEYMMPENVGKNNNFRHFSVMFDTSDVCVNMERATLYENAVAHFLPIITECFNKHCFEGIKSTLEIITERITLIRGGSTYLGALNWAKEWFVDEWNHMSPFDQSLHCVKAIIACNVSKGNDSVPAIMTLFQQMKDSILPLLADEKTRSIESFLTVMEQRLDPLAYQRRIQSELSAGQIEIAKRTLGNFENYIPSRTQLARATFNAYMVKPKPANTDTKPANTGSMWDNVHPTRQSVPTQKAHGAASFASRIGVPSFVPPATLAELIVMILNGKIDSLEVLTTNHTPCSVVYVDLPPEKTALEYPHVGWTFHNDRRFNKSGFFKVHSIVDIGNARLTGAVFVIDDDVFSCNDNMPGCFSEFLSTDIRRTCATAYEQAGKQIKVPVPIAPSHGVGLVHTKGETSCDVVLRANGVEFRINH
jgi:hypothetical protein